MRKITSVAIMLAIFLTTMTGFMYVMGIMSSVEENKPWITYEIVIPETEYTHVKVSILHNGEGGLDVDHTFKIQPIPENRIILYKTKFSHIFWMRVWLRYYNEAGSGYVSVDQESYSLEF